MNRLLITGIAIVLYGLAMGWNESPKPVNSYPILIKDDSFPKGKEGERIRYGRELIANTSYYLGPKGTVAAISNGMNCQNCHLQAGTKPFGLNYYAVASTYPKYMARSGSAVSIAKRINGCLERSLNGKALDTASNEMKAMIAYMKWIGSHPKEKNALAVSGIKKVPYLKVAASPAKGRSVYNLKCRSCHGKSGNGLLNNKGTAYIYPPLWGAHSFNDGAGLYRLSNFAGFVKSNMPIGIDHKHAQLTDQEAWNVAAFVNSQPRPHKDQSNDWKDLKTKPVDFPFGPYADDFSEQQHKYGPFQPMVTK